MGVVRREGKWRLEKVNDGLYEITYEKKTKATVTTEEYDPGMFDDRYAIGVPTHDVEAFTDAMDIFGSMSSNEGTSPVAGLDSLAGDVELEYDSRTTDESIGENLDELPAGGFALVLLSAGSIVLYSASFTVGSLAFNFGAALAVGGVAIFGWAAVVYKTSGPAEAWKFLTAIEENEDQESVSSESDNGFEKTPPAPQSLKDELFFERAKQSCEWCEERVDQPEVHHIESRSEGGSNERSNLIVLCPGCHAKADRGGISRTKLRAKVRRVTENISS